MNGKLARVEEQEKLLLERYLNKTRTNNDHEEIQTNDESQKKKKKRKHKDDEEERDDEITESEKNGELQLNDLIESNGDSVEL